MPNTMRDGSVTARLLHAVPRRGLVQPSAAQREPASAGASHTGNPCLALLRGTASTKPTCRACLACLIIAHKTGCCMLVAGYCGMGLNSCSGTHRPLPSLWSRSRGRNLSVSCFRLGWQLRAASQPTPFSQHPCTGRYLCPHQSTPQTHMYPAPTHTLTHTHLHTLAHSLTQPVRVGT